MALMRRQQALLTQVEVVEAVKRQAIQLLPTMQVLVVQE